jgi:hypothetical protein
MNERIKQLAKQAGCKVMDDGEWYIPSATGLEKIVYTKGIGLEKFAELIVAECAELFVDQKYMILNPHEPFANERVRALKEHDKDTVRKIKGHFGVEE